MNKPIKLTTDVKKQHTVPRFLLDNFGFGKKGKKRRLFTFDKSNGRIFQQSVFDATTRNGFYDIENHPQKASLEPVLEIYETKTAPIIKGIIERRSIAHLSDDDKLKIATFIIIQYLRSYSQFQRIKHLIDSLQERLALFGATAEQIEAELGKNELADQKNIFLSMILDQLLLVKYLRNKVWILYETEKRDPFFISDSPITMHNDIDMGAYGNIGLAVEGIQIHLPLSSTLTLALICPTFVQSMVERAQIISHVITPTSMFKLIQAFRTGTPIKLESENVRLLNSLQVGYAEQYIYCEKEAFGLVQEMLARSSQYKTGFRMVVG